MQQSLQGYPPGGIAARDGGFVVYYGAILRHNEIPARGAAG